MTVTYHDIPIKVTDVFISGGIKLAAVEAVEGKPFVGGDKWPVRTQWQTVKYDELVWDHYDECTCVLPEQSCSICRARVHEDYTPEFERNMR